jgi:hypothetical protein
MAATEAATEAPDFQKTLTKALLALGVPEVTRPLAKKIAAKINTLAESKAPKFQREIPDGLAKICIRITDAAKLLKINISTAYQWLDSGRITRAIDPRTKKTIDKIHNMTVVSRKSVEFLLGQ